MKMKTTLIVSALALSGAAFAQTKAPEPDYTLSYNVGATTVSAGTLQVGTGGTIGRLGSGPIINNATLVYNRSDAITISNAISGSGTFTLQGGTVATFQGTNTSSGTLVVSAGAADVGVSGSIQCPISLASGTSLIVTNNPLFTLNQTLSGFGTVDGGLTAVGGTLRPGGSSAGGILTFLNGLTNTGPVTYEMELATAGASDLVTASQSFRAWIAARARAAAWCSCTTRTGGACRRFRRSWR